MIFAIKTEKVSHSSADSVCCKISNNIYAPGACAPASDTEKLILDIQFGADDR